MQLDTIIQFPSGSMLQNSMCKCYKLYDDCMLFLFLGSNMVRSIDTLIQNINPQFICYFFNFLQDLFRRFNFFSWNFGYVHHIRPNVESYYIYFGVLHCSLLQIVTSPAAAAAVAAAVFWLAFHWWFRFKHQPEFVCRLYSSVKTWYSNLVVSTQIHMKQEVRSRFYRS